MVGKIFRSIALTMHLVGATANCEKSYIIVHNSLNFLEFLMEMQTSMSFISVPNLTEMETWEGYFYVTWMYLKKKNVKKIGKFLGTNISRTADAISFNFDVWNSVYVRQNLYKFGRNQLSSFGDTEGWIWQLCGTSK